jgi:ubiquinone/menaquinone biosynthesis C-methylase UbiE
MSKFEPRPPSDRRGPRPDHGPTGTGKPAGAGKPTGGKLVRKTDWSGVAEWYDDLVGRSGSEFHVNVVHPGVVKLIGAVKGKTVLDVACGQGVLCRLLHTMGASVTGVDGAVPLVELARRHGPAEIKYDRADATNADHFKSFADASIDVVTCVLAVQNFNPIQPMFAVASRVLKPGGSLIVVMMHPCFRNPKQTHWGWDDEAFVQFRRVDRYLIPRKEPIVTSPGKKDGKYTWDFHRPIGDYVRAGAQVGLLTDALEEWTSHKHSDSGPRAQAENTARKEIPMFLALRLIKAK